MFDNLLEIQELTKNYSGVHALNHVSFSIRRGEILALVGENGAGKSTLTKILTGVETPTSGKIVFNGEMYEYITPNQALAKGIVAIYQELSLIPYLTVAENIFFGCEDMKGIFRDVRSMSEKTVNLCKEMGVLIDSTQKITNLGMAYKQIVEIMKAVSKNAQLLIMDEPTASLTNTETEALYDIVKRLKNMGVTIIFISHRLEEIFDLCDRVTVMRDGAFVDTLVVDKTNKQQLMALMVGRELVDDYPQRVKPIGDVVLELCGLTNEKIHDINFKLHHGEILGIGGLVGAGRTELARAIYGIDYLKSGEIRLNGEVIIINSPQQALSYGIGLIPEDRKNHGVVLTLPIGQNITFSILQQLSKHLLICSNKEISVCEHMKQDLKIKTPNFWQQVKNLSGGNQQKVVLAKVLATDCKLLIFDEPTRGIDVGAKQEIYHLMRKLTEAGKSIIMISSEMPELIGMSDRILVMHEGHINGELTKEGFSQETILAYASQNNEEKYE